MATCYIMIGIPGSGKTTLADKMINELKNCIKVSTDEIRERLYGDPAIQGDGKKVFREAYDLTASYLKDGFTVIFDATNVTAKSRRLVMKNIDSRVKNVKYVAVYLPTPFTVASERNKMRDRVVPNEVVRRMSLDFEAPIGGEGFSKIITITN